MQDVNASKSRIVETSLRGVRWLIAGAVKRAAVAVGLCGSTLAERQAHLAACLNCERNHGGVCDACGCSVRHKVLLAGERCPIDRWRNAPRDAWFCRAVHWLVAKLGGPPTSPASRCAGGRVRLKVVGSWLDVRVAACLACSAHSTAGGWRCDGEPVAAKLRDPAWVCPRGKFGEATVEAQEGAA